jgi:hypothetical protein
MSGPRPALVTRFPARPEEHACARASIADRRFGHHDGDRQEAAGVLEKVAQVELAIFGIEEARASLALFVDTELHRKRSRRSQRFRDQLGERSER